MTTPRDSRELGDEQLVRQLIRRVEHAGRDDWRTEDLAWEIVHRLDARQFELRRLYDSTEELVADVGWLLAEAREWWGVPNPRPKLQLVGDLNDA